MLTIKSKRSSNWAKIKVRDESLLSKVTRNAKITWKKNFPTKDEKAYSQCTWTFASMVSSLCEPYTGIWSSWLVGASPSLEQHLDTRPDHPLKELPLNAQLASSSWHTLQTLFLSRNHYEVRYDCKLLITSLITWLPSLCKDAMDKWASLEFKERSKCSL